MRVHFLPAQQIIQSAHAVEDGVTGNVVTHQQALRAQHSVLPGGRHQPRLPEIGIIELQPFALAQGIPRQRHKAFLRQAGQYVLPGIVRLRPIFMTQGKEDCRERPRTLMFWHIKVRGDEELGLTLKDDLFDAIPIALHHPGYFCVKRGALRKTADIADDLPPDLETALIQRIHGGYPRPGGQMRPGFRDEIVGQRAGDLTQLPDGRRKVQIIPRLRGSCAQEEHCGDDNA